MKRNSSRKSARPTMEIFTMSSSSSSSYLCLLFLLLISTPTSSTTMMKSEVDTLFQIMEKMSSDKPWRSTYPNPCKQGSSSSSWPGIECKIGYDSHLHVARLDFGDPPNPTCKTTSTFPSEIFTLPFLQSAFFYHCFTHLRTTITFPTLSTSLNSTLEQLSLRSNPALMGKIPPQFSSLKSLQVLTLSQNRLSGPIPGQLSGLTSLVHLDLSYNLLTGSVPTEVGSLVSLAGLDFSYNSLVGPIPSTIGQLGLLQKLDLSSNKLMGVIPPSIEKLSSLAFLALSNNNFKGRFPTGIKKLVNLQYFLMDDNPMYINLPIEFGMLIKLQELRLANSGYSGAIPSTLCNLMNLTTLSLDNNRLTGKIPSGLSSLPHIYHLNLSKNYLEGVVPFNGTFFRRLQNNLDLSGNPGLCLDQKQANSVSTPDVSVCGKQKERSSSLLSSNGFQLHYHLNFVFFLSPLITFFSYSLSKID